MNKEQYIQWHLDESFLLWFRRASLWGAALFVLLGALDYVVTPENFRTFFLYRIIIASILAAVSLLAKQFSHRRAHHILAYGAIIGSAAAIELMIMQFGGHASSYYVRVFFTANAFTTMIFITALLMRYLSWKALVEDLTLRYDLERSREHFEEVAEERTRELTEATEQWEETFTTIDDVMAIHDRDFNVIRVNTA